MGDKAFCDAQGSEAADLELLNAAVWLSTRRLGAVGAWCFLCSPNERVNGRRPLDLLSAPDCLQAIAELLDHASAKRWRRI
jgi:hypothetical protein